MSEANDLLKRIDAEFSALEDKHKKAQVEQVQAYQQRQKRLQKLGQAFESLRGVWRPRLEVLVKKFGEKVKVTPHIVPSTREATFEFQSNLARITLKFSASTDRDVHNVILSSDLDIVPILTRFDTHSEIEFPIDAVDKEAVARWIDDRIVSFVRTYLSLHENDYYLKDEMVEDPVAKIRFPRFAAGATLQSNGKTYYFIGEETRQAFEKQHGGGSK